MSDSPQFGPPMSPAIFATKWLRKFRELFFDHFFAYFRQTPYDPVFWCIFCLEGWEHILDFLIQARELALRVSDFPHWPLPPVPGDEPLILASPDEIDPAQVNPWFMMAKTMLVADCLLGRLDGLRQGEELYECRWVEVPLELRREVDQLGQFVEEARREGWWRMAADVRRSTMESLEKSEEIADGVFFWARKF